MAKAKVEAHEATPYDDAESQTAAILAIHKDLTEGESDGKVTSTDVANIFAKTAFAKGREMDKLKALCSSTISLHKSKSRPEGQEPRVSRSEPTGTQGLTLAQLIAIKTAMKDEDEDVIQRVAKLAKQVGGLDRLLEGLEALKQLRD